MIQCHVTGTRMRLCIRAENRALRCLDTGIIGDEKWGKGRRAMWESTIEKVPESAAG